MTLGTPHHATGASCSYARSPSSAPSTASDTSFATSSLPVSPDLDSEDSDNNHDGEEADDPGVTPRPLWPRLLTGRMAAHRSWAWGNRAGIQLVLKDRAAHRTATVDGVE